MRIGVDESVPRRQLLITQRLRQRRCDLGLTQQQVVSRLIQHGLSTTNRALSSLEHGAGLEVAKLPAFAHALDCTTTYLVGLTDDPQQWEPDPAESRAQPRPRTSAAPGPLVETPAGHSLILGVNVPDRGPYLTTLDG